MERWRRILAWWVMLFAGAAGCNGQPAPESPRTGAGERAPASSPDEPAGAKTDAAARPTDPEEGRWAEAREAMVRTQIEGRDVRDPRVLAAMRAVPRHRYVPETVRERAYGDHPLPIGFDQTISQPYIVAFMTEALGVHSEHKILEVGTGSGYQAAVLAMLARKVYSIEIVEGLANRSRQLLRDEGFANLEVRAGDGYRGWPDQAPFDGIIVTCAPDHVPPALKEQLKVGGRLVIPVGAGYQELLLITRTESGFSEQRILPVRFVPMTGEAQEPK